MVPNSNLILANPVGDFVGNVSYSWYLLHLPVLALFERYVHQHPLFILPVFVAVSLFVSYLVYRFFESPSRRAIRKYFG